jgi:CubicO group peptidase (beta-lactamase class C family)
VEKHGESLVETGAGFADREAGRKMTADTIFRYSSLTKPIVATATMALVERGVIRLDDPVTRWLPAFRPRLSNGDEPRIEVRHLLTHTAGLSYAMLQPAGGAYESAGISDGLRSVGRVHQRGVGAARTRSAGLPTWHRVGLFPSRIFDADAFASGGAGMAGTARDFQKLMTALQSDGAPVLKPETARQMRSNQIGALRLTAVQQPAWGFGFGGAVLMESVAAGTPQAAGTWQWGGVYGHHWYVDPVNRLTVIALTNTALEGMAGGFVAELMEAVYGG